MPTILAELLIRRRSSDRGVLQCLIQISASSEPVSWSGAGSSHWALTSRPGFQATRRDLLAGCACLRRGARLASLDRGSGGRRSAYYSGGTPPFRPRYGRTWESRPLSGLGPRSARWPGGTDEVTGVALIFGVPPRRLPADRQSDRSCRKGSPKGYFGQRHAAPAVSLQRTVILADSNTCSGITML